MDNELNKYNPNREANGRFGAGSNSDSSSGSSGGSSGGSDNSGGGGQEEPVDVGEFEGMGRGGDVGPDTMSPSDVANDATDDFADTGMSTAEAVLMGEPAAEGITQGWQDQDYANLAAMSNLDGFSQEAIEIIQTPSWEKPLNASLAKNNPSLIVDVVEGKMVDKTARWTEKEWSQFEKIASETNKQRGDFVKMVSIAKAKETLADIPSVKAEMEELEKSGVSQVLLGSYNNETYLKAYKRN